MEEWFKEITESPDLQVKGSSNKCLTVVFRNLGVYGFDTSSDYQRTFGNLGWSSLNNLLGRHKAKVQILHSFNGLVKNGECLLVLGRPGSGCTTLLRALAGDTHGIFIDSQSVLTYEGEISSSDGSLPLKHLYRDSLVCIIPSISRGAHVSS